MSRISEAVILMAGSGARLRVSDKEILKPLVLVLGRPLICYTMNTLVHAEIRKVNVVVGYESKRLRAAVQELAPSGLELCFIENPNWQKQNGISLLAAADSVVAPFLLAMSDHLFDNAIVDGLIASADLDRLNLAIDRKLNSIFDLDDAMKLQTRENQIVAIGKKLQNYDSIDTGLFVCPLEVFKYLERSKQDGDCSLADGVRLMAADNKVRAVDIGEAWWHDIDTPQMLEHAEKEITSRSNVQTSTK